MVDSAANVLALGESCFCVAGFINHNGTQDVALVQPAQRIELCVAGNKLLHEYQDLLNTNVTRSVGTHLLSVVGVDAAGKYIKSNTTYTVKGDKHRRRDNTQLLLRLASGNDPLPF